MHDVRTTKRERKLSDLVSGINAHWGKTYHLGLGSRITKSNLAKAIKDVTGESLLSLPIV